MHLKANINIVEFLEQVKKCDGEVLYETPEGDRIALKSTLSQYIVFDGRGAEYSDSCRLKGAHGGQQTGNSFYRAAGR